MSRKHHHLKVNDLIFYNKLIFKSLLAFFGLSLLSVGLKANVHSFKDQPPLIPNPSLSALISDYNGYQVSCKGASNGSIDLTVSGIGPFSFLWSNGETTEDISNLSAGNYTVTVTDNNGDITTETYTLTEPDAITLSNITSQPVVCFGQNNGSIDVTISGGVSPYNFQWSNGETTEDINNLIASTYTLTITDLNNCTTTFPGITITEPSLLQLSALTSNTNCGNAVGSIDLSANGGIPSYTFLWSNGSTLEDISNLSAGVYTVTVTDQNSCTASAAYSIAASTQPSVVIDSVKNVLCFGQNTGAIYISVINANGSVNYLWNNGSTTQNLIGVVSGIYTITITDSTNCQATLSQNISQPSDITNSFTFHHATCGQSNGWIAANVAGGSSPYSFNWNTGATTNSISGLLPGNYSLTVTDNNLCSKIFNVTLSNLPGPTITIDSVRQVRCFGLNTGAIFTTTTNANGPITYLWNTGSASKNLLNVVAGNYTLTVTDSSGCQSQISQNISQPSDLSVNLNPTNAACGQNNGSISSSVTGGVAGYSYLWNTGTVSAGLSALAPGNYTVTVTDANNCTKSSTASITNLSGPTITLDSVKNVSCFGQSNGGIFISVSGNSPFTFQWNNGTTTEDVAGLLPGNYTVTVTDAANCSSTLSQSITQPADISITLSPVNESCNLSNGRINSTIAGGNSPYTYLWNNGQTTSNIVGLSAGSYTLTVTDNNNCVKSASVTLTSSSPVITVDSVRNVRCFGQNNGAVFISITGNNGTPTYLWNTGSQSKNLLNVIAGNYTLTVTDTAGCQATITQSITQPADITIQLTGNNSACGQNNGSINAIVSGGTPVYAYSWNTGSTASAIASLSPGNYTITVTDSKNCTKSNSRTILNLPPPNIIIDSVRPVSCNGGNNGAAYTSCNNHNGPFTYLWNTGATTANLIGITAGSYTVTVTDSAGCTASSNVTISQPAAPLTLNTSAVSARCGNLNGSASVVASGGTPAYSYLWNTGQSTAAISNISGGVYSVTVTDSKSCTSTASITVGSLPPVVIHLDTVVQIKCAGQNTGAIKVTVSGGSGTLSYNWTPALAGTDSVFNLGPGTYKLVVRDTANCSDSITVTLVSPPALNPNLNAIAETCGNNNGMAWAIATGGTPGYTYLWNNNAVNDTIFNLSKGTYTITITDANGCTFQSSVFIDSLGGPGINDSVVNVKCFGGNTGAILTTITGGSGPFTYQWSPGGQATPNISNLLAGTYTVTVTDTNNCTSTKSINVSQPLPLAINFSTVSEKCGQSNGSATAAVSGGVSPYQYLWNTGANINNITNKPAGTYVITVTDSNLCVKTDSVIIGFTAGPSITGFNRSLVKCHNDSSGALTVNVSGGTPSFSYQWSSPLGGNNATIQNIPFGVYTVTVTDINNCTASAVDSLKNPPLISISHVLVNANCNLNNGIATVNVSGGIAPYSYNWSNGVSGTNFIDTLSNNFYSVTITDSLGCIKTDTFTINRNPAPQLQLSSVNNVTCYGLSNGNINITPSGGDGNYFFQWSYNNIQTQNISNIPAGSYTVTVTDGTGCSYTMPDIQVIQPDTLIATTSTTPTGCVNASGSATVALSGGTLPYSYLWSNGALTPTASGLNNQTYTVTVTDFNGCTTIASAVVGTTPAINANILNYQNINCYGAATGYIDVVISGGSPPLSFQWSNNLTTQNIANLSAGTYTLTITDSAQCTTTISQVLTQNPQLNFSLTLVAGPCNGGTPGVAITAPSGGASTPSILWSNGSTSNTVQAVAGTLLTLTISDNVGCSRDTTFSIPSTNGPQVTNIQKSDVTCFGDSTGSASISVTGGTLPITYQWLGTNPIQTLPTAINLKAGNYTCIVTDINGCTAIASVSINHIYPAIVPVLNIVNASCGINNGQITVTASGGSGVYTYKIDNGSYTSNNIFSNIPAAAHNVYVKDSAGCEIVVIATVSNIQGPLISVIDTANVSCNGRNDGFILLNVSGQAQPITYSWSDGPTVLNRNNLAPGNYTFTAIDANNCISVRSFEITEPTAIIINEIIPNKNGLYPITCNGLSDGEIQIIASGGTPHILTSPYTYQWSVSGATGSTVTSLSAGPYTVTVTDSLGCNTSKTIFLTEPPLLEAGMDISQSICGIDTLTLTAITPAYGSGKWILKSGNASISNPDSVSTEITAIANGVNVFVWVVYDDFCSDSANYIINKKEKIIADAGIDQDVCNNYVFLSAVPPQSGTGLWQLINGNGIIQNSNTPTTRVDNLQQGLNIFSWNITNGNCTDADTVVIDVLPPEQCYTEVVMPTGFTPNDDGFNDYFVIRGLDNNDNTFTVFNRWGNLVYEKKNYQNNWDGRSSNNQILPDGTYYAILRIPSRNIVLKSYIDLRR
jgi:gliding motility-associated-like protein